LEPANTEGGGPRSLPLERRLPLLVLGLLAFVLAISLFVSYYEIRASAEASARDRLASLSRVVSSLLQQQVAARLNAMHRVAADSAIVDALQSPTKAPSLDAKDALGVLTARADSLTPPMLLTTDGRPIGDVHLETPADAERYRAEIHDLAATPDSSFVSHWYTADGHSSFWMAVPVKRSGQLLGYLAQERRFNASPRALQPFLDLIGSDIEMYFRNTSDSTWVQLTGKTMPAPTASAEAFDSLNIFTHGAKGAALASTSRVGGTPFLVTVEYPMQRLLARPRATARTLAVIALLLTVIGAVIAWAISRQMTKPLVELTSAAEAIAHGEYSQRVHARGSAEIGKLGTAFNRMAAQVQVSSNASEQAVIRLTYSAALQEFLAEASRILAESVSDQTLLADLAQFCVPTLSDYCSIYVVDDDGNIRRVETAHYDATKREAARALVQRYHPRLDAPGPVSDVIRTQKPVLISLIDQEAVRRNAPDDAAVQLFDEVMPTATMAVPLIARGRALGAVAFTMTDSGRTFSQDDLDLAMELARRTAVAVDNGMIYKRSLQLRLEAEAASSAKSDFLAKMSHEIRTPINAMLGYAELLEMGITGPITDGQAKYLARIRSSGDHLTSLVNEILDLAKIEAGRMDVEPSVGPASDAIDAALGLIRPQAAAKNVHLVNRSSAEMTPQYLGDPQRVQQILTNLLSNAVKFTNPGGLVSIHAGTGTRTDHEDPQMPWTCIVVEDSGIGISNDDRERIFQPFVQVENGYTRAHGGTGLGLTISRTLAHMMGGELAVSSTLGEGSRFTLWLPVPQESDARV
jgi:signal transduction histidine kinase